jgi:Tripartite tricarboxylate transporter TctB family
MGLGTTQELGPGLVPLIASLVILGTGIVLIVRTLLGKGQPPQAKNSESLHQKGWIRVLVILSGLAIWPLLSSVTGYVIPTFLVSVCIAKATGYSGWRGPALLGAGISLGIWILFSRVFSTDLPAGLFF